MGERLAGFIYGTIVVLAVIAAGAKAYPGRPGRVALLVVVTSGVFWLAHVYAHALGESVARDRHLERADLARIARHEGAMVEAALPAIVALLLGAAGVLSTGTAVWVAFALGLGVLAAQGIVFARVERLGTLATLGVVAANLGLGVLLVGLKVFVTH
jgi:hypothetical protein